MSASPDEVPGRRLAIAAEGLYLANLLLAPGLAFLVLAWLYGRRRRAPPKTCSPCSARNHILPPGCRLHVNPPGAAGSTWQNKRGHDVLPPARVPSRAGRHTYPFGLRVLTLGRRGAGTSLATLFWQALRAAGERRPEISPSCADDPGQP